jgi:hypothetical protein
MRAAAIAASEAVNPMILAVLDLSTSRLGEVEDRETQKIHSLSEPKHPTRYASVEFSHGLLRRSGG